MTKTKAKPKNLYKIRLELTKMKGSSLDKSDPGFKKVWASIDMKDPNIEFVYVLNLLKAKMTREWNKKYPNSKI